MSEKNLIHTWKKIISSKPHLRDTVKRMHLSVLHQATRHELGKGLWYIRFEIQDLVLCELKGEPVEVMSLELPAQANTLWLCMQFHGALSFSSGYRSEPDTMFSFLSNDTDNNLLTVLSQKQWVLFLGIKGASREQVLGEFPLLREQHGALDQRIGAAVPITYVSRQALEQFSSTAFGSFSTVHHIGLLLTKLCSAYVEQMVKLEQGRGKDQDLILLYHQALDYITEHYMEEQLNREKIAESCNCSVRKLTRAFEGRGNTIKSTILLMRLHKSRELLYRHPELTVEDIAGMVHFFDAKHFSSQYKKYFHRTPREERKIIRGT